MTAIDLACKILFPLSALCAAAALHRMRRHSGRHS